jgi:hypothetical protein
MKGFFGYALGVAMLIVLLYLGIALGNNQFELEKVKNELIIAEISNKEKTLLENNTDKNQIQKIDKIETLLGFKDDQIIMFLRGGVGKIVSGVPQLATAPGDIGLVLILRTVLMSMEFVSKDTLVLIVGSNETQ